MTIWKWLGDYSARDLLEVLITFWIVNGFFKSFASRWFFSRFLESAMTTWKNPFLKYL